MHTNKTEWEANVHKFAEEYKDNSPFDDVLARELAGCSFEEQRISYRFATKDWWRNERGEIHGGMICSMFDSAVGTVAIYAAGWKEAATTDLNISYLRSLPGGTHAVVHTYIVKNGRTMIRLRGEMICEETGKLIATATGNWLPL